ncbi:MAG: hypothetical protein E4G93_03250 [Dehalococcoidia bacterium]|nr:MAG: hypothetical protein E4G93_03250 [Dehalococcoidia bacterium]
MGRIIYEERLFSRWITLMLGVVTLLMLWQVTRQLQGGSPADGAPSWLLPLMLLLFALLTINFAWLTIRFTDEEAVIGYGVLRSRIRWQDILDCYPDDASVGRYGGWGIRFGSYNGRRRLIYNTISDPRVVLHVSGTSFPELVFSTAQPEDVVNWVREHLRSLKR